MGRPEVWPATYRIFAERGVNARVLVTHRGRSDLVIDLDEADPIQARQIAHAVAAVLYWERDESIEIHGCDCAGEHAWDTHE